MATYKGTPVTVLHVSDRNVATIQADGLVFPIQGSRPPYRKGYTDVLVVPADDLVDDCDCAGPNDAPGCPACAEAAAKVYPIEESF